MFGLFSGDKKTQETTVNTSTVQTDSSRNIGDGAISQESGANFSVVTNDLSETVARDSLAAQSSVARDSLGAQRDVAMTGMSGATELGALAIKTAASLQAGAVESVSDAANNATIAAQNAVTYGRNLAEMGFAAKTSADTGGATATIDSAGKYIVGAIALLAVAVVGYSYFLGKKA